MFTRVPFYKVPLFNHRDTSGKADVGDSSEKNISVGSGDRREHVSEEPAYIFEFSGFWNLIQRFILTQFLMYYNAVLEIVITSCVEFDTIKLCPELSSPPSAKYKEDNHWEPPPGWSNNGSGYVRAWWKGGWRFELSAFRNLAVYFVLTMK